RRNDVGCPVLPRRRRPSPPRRAGAGCGSGRSAVAPAAPPVQGSGWVVAGGRATGLARKVSSIPSMPNRASSASSLSTSARRPGSFAQAASSRARCSSAGRSAAWWNRSSPRSPCASAIGLLSPLRRRGLTQPSGQPGAGEAPLAHHGADRPADDVGGLRHAQAGVIAELDDLRQVRLFRPELLNRLVQRQQVVGCQKSREQASLENYLLPA